MEAPYGTWSSPIDGAAVAQDRGWTYSLVTVDGRGRPCSVSHSSDSD